MQTQAVWLQDLGSTSTVIHASEVWLAADAKQVFGTLVGMGLVLEAAELSHWPV